MWEKREGVYAVVVAGGSGTRMGTAVKKQFLPLAGKPLLYYSLAACEASDLIDSVVLVTGAEDVRSCEEDIVSYYSFSKVKRVVAGGNERYHSVLAGLRALPGADNYEEINFFSKDVTTRSGDFVIIHDGARPLLTDGLIRRTLEGAAKSGACVAAVPVRDTIKIADDDNYVTGTPDRSSLRAMQTPQTFRIPLIRYAYERLVREEATLLKKGVHITDDAMAVETFCPGTRVLLVDGEESNLKVTTPTDLILAEHLLKQARSQE